MRTTIRRNAAIAWEKSLRLPANNPRSRLVTGVPHHLATKGSWRRMAKEEESNTGLGDLVRLPLPSPDPPWLHSKREMWRIGKMLPINKAKLTNTQQRSVVCDSIGGQGPFEYTMYSDGTPWGKDHDSGAATVVTTGTIDKPVKIKVCRRRGWRNASAFEAEVEGLKLAVEWVQANEQSISGQIMICTDCKDITVCLSAPSMLDDVEIRDLRSMLNELQITVIIQWVPGHVGLQGNEWADGEARIAVTGQQRGREVGKGVSLSSAKARIRKAINDPPISHARTNLVYQGKRGREDTLTRKEAVLLAQLRSGHCRRLAAYHKVIDDTVDPICQRCGQEPETLEHWLQRCSASVESRRLEFGVASPPLKVLFQDPVAVLAFCRGSNWAV